MLKKKWINISAFDIVFYTDKAKVVGTLSCGRQAQVKYIWQTTWTSYQMRKIEGCARAGNAGNDSPLARVSNTDMHDIMCVTHVPWCMPRSLTSGFLISRLRGNVPGIPGECATRNFTNLVRGPWLPMTRRSHAPGHEVLWCWLSSSEILRPPQPSG